MVNPMARNPSAEAIRMYRKVSVYLEQWQNNPYRKPLIIQGARQVGKTYSILEFGKTHYENVAYFNFQTSPTLVAIVAEQCK